MCFGNKSEEDITKIERDIECGYYLHILDSYTQEAKKIIERNFLSTTQEDLLGARGFPQFLSTRDEVAFGVKVYPHLLSNRKNEIISSTKKNKSELFSLFILTVKSFDERCSSIKKIYDTRIQHILNEIEYSKKMRSLFLESDQEEMKIRKRLIESVSHSLHIFMNNFCSDIFALLYDKKKLPFRTMSLEKIASFLKKNKQVSSQITLFDIFYDLWIKEQTTPSYYDTTRMKKFLYEEIFNNLHIKIDDKSYKNIFEISVFEFLLHYLLCLLPERGYDSEVDILYRLYILPSVLKTKFFSSSERRLLFELFEIITQKSERRLLFELFEIITQKSERRLLFELFEIITQKNDNTYKYFFFANEEEPLFFIEQLPQFLQGFVLEYALQKEYHHDCSENKALVPA
jgi:hypothetical protein